MKIMVTIESIIIFIFLFFCCFGIISEYILNFYYKIRAKLDIRKEINKQKEMDYWIKKGVL